MAATQVQCSLRSGLQCLNERLPSKWQQLRYPWRAVARTTASMKGCHRNGSNSYPHPQSRRSWRLNERLPSKWQQPVKGSPLGVVRKRLNERLPSKWQQLVYALTGLMVNSASMKGCHRNGSNLVPCRGHDTVRCLNERLPSKWQQRARRRRVRIRRWRLNERLPSKWQQLPHKKHLREQAL